VIEKGRRISVCHHKGSILRFEKAVGNGPIEQAKQ
jgi:hypothetical protein